VKVVEVLNGLPLLMTKRLGELWSGWSSARDIGSFRTDTWVRAWLYFIASSAQWLMVGAALMRVASSSSRQR
jgi:hypothetical protein